MSNGNMPVITSTTIDNNNNNHNDNSNENNNNNNDENVGNDATDPNSRNDDNMNNVQHSPAQNVEQNPDVNQQGVHVDLIANNNSNNSNNNIDSNNNNNGNLITDNNNEDNSNKSNNSSGGGVVPYMSYADIARMNVQPGSVVTKFRYTVTPIIQQPAGQGALTNAMLMMKNTSGGSDERTNDHHENYMNRGRNDNYYNNQNDHRYHYRQHQHHHRLQYHQQYQYQHQYYYYDQYNHYYNHQYQLKNMKHFGVKCYRYDASTEFSCLTQSQIRLILQHAPALENYVAMDCEMVGVGLYGLENELARVSVVDFTGRVLIDAYVRPRQQVIDYRTRVSGIRPDDISNGDFFEKVQGDVIALLQDKILVGHAVYNDLKVLNVKHPLNNIRDTALYRPFAEFISGGATPSLKRLTKVLLNKTIQNGEHDSVEDARAAMSIYLKYRDIWELRMSFTFV